MTRPDIPATQASGPTYPQVIVRITGRDRNALAIIAAVARALRHEIDTAAATAFTEAAFDCDSYDTVLVLAQNTVTTL